jgi:hypothetical protein
VLGNGTRAPQLPPDACLTKSMAYGENTVQLFHRKVS